MVDRQDKQLAREVIAALEAHFQHGYNVALMRGRFMEYCAQLEVRGERLTFVLHRIHEMKMSDVVNHLSGLAKESVVAREGRVEQVNGAVSEPAQCFDVTLGTLLHQQRLSYSDTVFVAVFMQKVAGAVDAFDLSNECMELVCFSNSRFVTHCRNERSDGVRVIGLFPPGLLYLRSYVIFGSSTVDDY